MGPVSEMLAEELCQRRELVLTDFVVHVERKPAEVGIDLLNDLSAALGGQRRNDGVEETVRMKMGVLRPAGVISENRVAASGR